ncbi:MAG: hypothetical protein WAM39_04315 [Bryobacteraceae bacterium]
MPSKIWAAMGVLTLLLLARTSVFCQANQTGTAASTTPSANQAPAPAGLQAPWDIRQMLAALNAQNERLKPLLEQMHPQEWLENGAPPAYVSQYQEVRTRMDDVIRAVKNLSQQTDSLSVALDTYFRMEALETVARSVDDCIRKYGERKTADQLSALIAQNFDNRQKFCEYLRDLSVEREQEFKIADEEAQRCRGMISKEPSSPSSTRKNRKQ